MLLVQTTNLSKTFHSGTFRKTQIHALRDVTISVNQGEIFGLLGPNGAGKTTLVKILLSIAFPSSGSAEILGMPLGSTAIRRNTGYLPENHRYPGFLTAFDTLKYFGRLIGLTGQPLRTRTDHLLDLVGLSEWKRVKVKKFSKGMVQRLGLAQSLLNDPQILFLDEPTDGVDPVGRKDIRDILISLRKSGKTIFLNSHMLSEVEEVSDRVAILNKGMLLYSGTMADITSTEPVYEILMSQPPSESVLQSIRSLCTDLLQTGNQLIVTLRDRKDFQAILDLMRTQGCQIESFSPRKSRLEDHFMNLIKSATP